MQIGGRIERRKGGVTKWLEGETGRVGLREERGTGMMNASVASVRETGSEDAGRSRRCGRGDGWAVCLKINQRGSAVRRSVSANVRTGTPAHAHTLTPEHARTHPHTHTHSLTISPRTLSAQRRGGKRPWLIGCCRHDFAPCGRAVHVGMFGYKCSHPWRDELGHSSPPRLYHPPIFFSP